MAYCRPIMVRTLCPRPSGIRAHLHVAIRDVLYELASVGDLPLPQPSPAPSNKRERDSDTTLSAGSSPAAMSPSSQSSVPEGPRTIAGSKRVARDHLHAHHHHHSQPTPQGYPSPLSNASPDPSSTGAGYGLPMYTEELGRVPLHGFCDIQNWQSDPMMSTMQGNTQGAPATATAAAAASAGLDPNLASIFAMPPTLYEQPLPPSQSNPGPSNQPDYTSYMGGMSGLGGHTGGSHTGESMGDPAGAPFPDTLAIWSNAPAGFEYVLYSLILIYINGLTCSVLGGTTGGRISQVSAVWAHLQSYPDRPLFQTNQK